MVSEALLAWTPALHYMHDEELHIHMHRVCEGRDVGGIAVQDLRMIVRLVVMRVAL